MLKKIILVIFFMINSSYGIPKRFRLSLNDPDEYVNTSTLIRSKGYPAEEHQVTTKDGYILNIHRIPNYRSASGQQLPVVFLQHGLLDASSTWAINLKNQSLGFILADQGYDVWMGNVRGNSYGLNHTKLNPTQEEFWNFSWSDIAHLDLPAMIDYVIKQTGEKNLIYMGHSQGTMIAFSQLGTNLDLASKIKLFIALGPVSTVGHIKSPISILGDIGASTKQLIWYNVFGRRNFLPSSKDVEWLADKLCTDKVTDKAICENVLFVICGPSKNLNETRLPVYYTHTPAGTSVKNMIHFSQMYISKKFQMYDFGSAEKNMQAYNQTTPPLYDLSTIKTPVALYWAQEDWLADPKDVEYIRNNLPNIVDDYDIKNWDHLDFIWATDTKPALYDRILNLIKRY